MIEIPIFDSFGKGHIIGHLSIDPDKLPATPDFCFALGYQQAEREGSYQLVAVAPVHDVAYVEFLQMQARDQRDPGDTREARG